MFTSRTVFAIVSVLTLAVLIAGCGSDNTSGPGVTPSADFSGTWTATSEILSKQTCTGLVGDQRDGDFSIGQDGSRASLFFSNFFPYSAGINLTVVESDATGSGTNRDGETYTVALSKTDDTIEGTLTVVTDECTEVVSLTATRIGSAPAAGFAGSWDLGLRVNFSNCDDEPFGTEEEICREILIRGNSLIVNDSDGSLLGVANGNFATFWSGSAEELRLVNLTLDGTTLEGSSIEDDLLDDCTVETQISGTRRSEACPPQPTVSDFVGSWVLDINGFGQSGCIFGEESDYIGQCVEVSASGSTLTLNTNSAQGVLTGSIEESGAKFTRVDSDGVFTVYLQREGDLIVGSALYSVIAGECSGTEVDVRFEGIRTSVSCSASGGPFQGSWIFSGQYAQNECGFRPISVECNEIVQFGDVVFIDGDLGTVSGNTVTSTDITETPEGRFSVISTLQISGEIITGSITISVEDFSDPELNCTSVINFTATRTSSCDQVSLPGSLGFGLLPELSEVMRQFPR